MLFGKIIFIKKGGGDGSKYPVKEKSVSIGSSDKCSIRIHNAQVAPKHCQLIVDDLGQVKLRNFSEVIHLNDKPLKQKDVTLCHGDIFKIGDRLARWEYFPSSKYYKQLLSPNGRLVAVVMPQQRSQISVVPPGTSAGQISPKSTLLGNKRKSEKINLEEGSAKKLLKTTNENKVPNGIKNVAKIISGRHSYQTAKMLFSPKIKMRKSTSCINSSKTSVLSTEKKPSLLFWEVNPVSPILVKKSSQRKSTPIKKSAPSKLTKPIRNSSIIKSLNTIEESPSNENNDAKRLTRSVNNLQEKQKSLFDLSLTPKKKSSFVKVNLVGSESKLNSRKNVKLEKSVQLQRLSLGPKFDKTFEKHSFKKVEKSNINVVSENVKNRDNVELKNLSLNFSSKIFDTKIKFNKNSQAKIQTVTSESHIFSLNKNEKNVEEKPLQLPARTSNRISSPNKSKIFPSKEIVKKSTLNPAVKKRKASVQTKRSPKMGVRKIKICSPSRPDKNKKAALLVLGKANRKHMLAQNVKILLKQKIIKKAIKQSTTVPEKKDFKMEKLSEQNKKSLQNLKRQKKINKTEVLKAKKCFNKGFSEASRAKSIELNCKKSGTKSIHSFEEVSKETKNSETALSSSKDIFREENTPKTFKIKLCETSSESSKKSKSTNFYDAKMVKNSRSLINSAESYILNSNRRCSKRLSSKSDISKPDFMELSPTALGLIPKNIEFCKTPKQRRKSITLVTPKNNCITGIVKSTSTSKLGQMKSVRFSKNFDETSQSTSFDFENIQTPNITLDVFVSPLKQKTIDKYSSSSKKRKHPESDLKISSNIEDSKSKSKSMKCARKILQSPQVENNPKRFSALKQSPLNTTKIDQSLEFLNLSKSTKTISPKFKNILNSPASTKKVIISRKFENSHNGIKIGTPDFVISPENENTKKNDLSRVSQSVNVSNNRKSLRSNVSNSLFSLNDSKMSEHDFNNAKHTNQCLGTFELQKNSANNETNVSTKRVSKNQKENKSPKNKLNNKAKQKIFRLQKTSKNELKNLLGVKELFSQKTKKSPKNDLTDIAEVKRLLRTPKANKSPKNDLSEVTGVKELLKTPRLQKSPRNELNDLRGVKELFSHKTRKSPKNDLTDIAGVKRLLRTPKANKSPKNDLSEVTGVKELLKTPRLQKSPRNELNDLRGVKELFLQKTTSPKDDLNDFSEVKYLMKSPQQLKSPKNDLNEFDRVNLFKQKINLRNNFQVSEENVTEFSGIFQSQRKSSGIEKTRDKQLYSTKEITSENSSPKNVIGENKEHSSIGIYPEIDYRHIKGRQTIYSTSNNYLTNVKETRQLTKNKPSNDLNISLTGVAELFDFLAHSPDEIKNSEESVIITRKRVVKNIHTEKKNSVISNGETPKKRGRPRIKVGSPSLKKPVRKKREILINNKNKEKKREIDKTLKTESSETNEKADESRRKRRLKFETSKSSDSSKKSAKTRCRSVSTYSESSSPKRRKKQAEKVINANVTEEKTEKRAGKKKSTNMSRKTVSTKRIRIDEESSIAPEKKTLLKVQSKTNSESIKKVQIKRSQTGLKKKYIKSNEKLSPIKTRSATKVTASKKDKNDEAQTTKTVRTKAKSKISSKKTESPIVTRSLRKK